MLQIQDAETPRRRGGPRGPRLKTKPTDAVRRMERGYFAGIAESSERPVEKTRFAALELVKEGRMSVMEVAAAVGVHQSSIVLWMTKFRDGGIEALREMRHPNIFLNGDGSKIRERAFAASDLSIRKPLLALADVMDGGRLVEIAKKYDVVAYEFQEWVDKVRETGIGVIEDVEGYPTTRSRQIVLRTDYDGNDLRLAAEGYEDEKAVRQMLALAMFYDGAELADIRLELGVVPGELRQWAEKFNQEGIAGLGNHVRKTALRQDFDAQAVEAVAVGCDDPETRKRCDVIVALYNGVPSITVARRYDTTRATVHNWCLRFNEHGRDWLTGASSQQGYTVAKKNEARREAVSRFAKEYGTQEQVMQDIEVRPRVTSETISAMREKAVRKLARGEKLSVMAITSWMTLEFDVLVDKKDVARFLVKAGFVLDGGNVVDVATPSATTGGITKVAA